MTETRAEKAQRLVDEGRVELIRRDQPIIWATVQGCRGSYSVFLHPSGNFFCTCDWGLYHSYTDDLCAHALAVKLAIKEKSL